MLRASLTRDPIDTSAVLGAVGSSDNGAALLFLGTVRQVNEGRAVTGMRYDAYQEMAEQVLAQIVTEAAAADGARDIVAVHRIGELALGEVSVAIAVATPHREQAYAASRRIIEQIKLRLPVWKQEHYADDASRWLEGSVPPESRA